jgi:hypothetical protein
MSEFTVFQKSGSFEKRRENMAIGWNGERAHGVEGREGKVKKRVRSVAFDYRRPCKRWWRRWKGVEEVEGMV